MKPPKDFDYDELVRALREGEAFSWARYGDGEWACLLQTRGGGNCDGHQYFPDLGLRLRDILYSKPKYYLGLQRLASEQLAEVHQFKSLVELNKDQWCNNEILHHASIKGRLSEFFEALEQSKKVHNREIVLVGNATLLQIKQLPKGFIFQMIPEKNCWLGYNSTLAELKKFVTRSVNNHQDVIILYCASMMTNVLIDDMHHEFGHFITQIDCGSVFDPYAGRNTRSYHKNLNIT